PDEVARAVFARTAVTMVFGEQDAFVTPERQREVLDRLETLTLPYRVVTYPGGHRMDGDVLLGLAG
ncbi:MAG: hypothetical protein WBA12_16035, partial [Catalinimonas sp.]